MFKIKKDKSILENCQELQRQKDIITNYLYKKDEFIDILYEFKELKQAISNNDKNNIEEEIGDVVFAVCRLANKHKINLDKAVKKSTEKFCKRVNFIAEKRDLRKMRRNSFKLLWQRAKDKFRKKEKEI